jgi:anti-sigma factor RsiW
LNCEIARGLMQADLDGELEVTVSLELETHLRECATCQRDVQRFQELRQAFGAAPLYYRAPAGLHRRIEARLRGEEKASSAVRALPRRWLVMAAVFALIAVLGWGWMRRVATPARSDLIAEEVLSSSMRSLIAGPLTGVESSDQHSVKPWFAGKLDFSPTVQDFGAQGFGLAGGRLDFVAGRPVAALVYRHQAHVINLYSWPSPGRADTATQEQNRNGYHVFDWTQNGLAYWAVSDMDASELRQFVQLARQP